MKAGKIWKTLVMCMSGIILFGSVGITSYAAQQSMEEGITPSGISYSNIHVTIENYVEEHRETMAGMSVAVYDENGVIYKNNFGYAEKENGRPVDENTVFEWGSVSKLFVWISAMQLAEQGKLDLEEDICTFLPENFLKNLSYDKKITMLDLMNHQAGFQEMYAGVQTAYENEVIRLEEALSKHQPKQIYEPGTVTAYSNWGAALAAYIIQNISGMDYADYVHENILEPLAMEHTSIGATLQDNIWVKQQRENLVCYDINGEKIPGKGRYYLILYPAGSATGTIDDFVTFAQAITPNKKAPCPLFKKQETLELMYTATSYYGESQVPNNYHGFFASQLGVETLGHGGNTFGCSSMLQFEPDSGMGMVVMTNQAHEQAYNYGMYELIFGKFTDSGLAYTERKVPQGFISSARTVQVGPFSLMGGISALEYSEEDLASWWYQDGDYIFGGYGDYFITTEKTTQNMICALLFVAAGGYGIITLVGGGLILSPMQKKIHKNKGIEKKHPYRKWNYAMAGMMALILADFGIMFIRLSMGTVSGNIGSVTSYMVQSGVIAMAAAGLLLCLLAGILYWCKKGVADTRGEKVKYVMTAFLAICMLIITVRFDMYQFWAI